MKKMCKYICMALFACFAMAACQSEELPTPVLAEVNKELIEPSYTSVVLTCDLISNLTIASVRAYVSPTLDFEGAAYGVLSNLGDGTYSGKVDGLQEATSYYVCYEIRNYLSSYMLEQVSEFQTFSYTSPVIYTRQVADIDFTSARVLATVKTESGPVLQERGVCYSQSANPTVEDTKVASGNGVGDYSCMLLYLEEGTEYHVRAYAVNDQGVFYGEDLSFTTLARTYHECHEYVDLGLSVMWATCNIGEHMPEKSGDYFAWGETTPKSKYDWSTYLWCKYTNDEWECLIKYNVQLELGAIDKQTSLNVSDDAARQNWGGDWRIPTNKEMRELISQCDWVLKENGSEVISRVNGNSIFLSAGGCMDGSSISLPGEGGYYWSSGLNVDDPKTAHVLYFNTIYDLYKYDISVSRAMGCFIRPVYSK